MSTKLIILVQLIDNDNVNDNNDNENEMMMRIRMIILLELIYLKRLFVKNICVQYMFY